MSLRCSALRIFLVLALPAEAQVPEPDGYRMGDYRAPVPAAVRGGSVIGVQALAALIKADRPTLIDVLPAPIRPPDAPAGRVWLPVTHRDIPGSLWLPDVGRGAISPALEQWFRETLRAATGGSLDRPVVFYCLSRCWMSWNATKRAIALGYRHAIWFEDGADGWEAAGLPLEPAHELRPGQEGGR